MLERLVAEVQARRPSRELDADLEVIAYDERMAEGARANGLRVVPPGR